MEAFTYRARDLLEDESFIAASTAEQRAKLEATLSDTSDWIYGDGHDATEEILKAKLKELKDIVDPVQKRKDEARKRPAAIKSLQETLEQTSGFTSVIKNDIEKAAERAASASEAASKAAEESATTSADPLEELEDEDMLKASSPEAVEPSDVVEPPIYSEEDLKALTGVCESVQKWLDDKQAAQAKLSEFQDPAFTVKDLEEQSRKLNSALMEMVQRKMRMPTKSKTAKPKATKKPKKATKDRKKKKGEKDEDAKAGPVKVKLGEDASMEEIEEAIEKAKQKAHDEL